MSNTPSSEPGSPERSKLLRKTLSQICDDFLASGDRHEYYAALGKRHQDFLLYVAEVEARLNRGEKLDAMDGGSDHADENPDDEDLK